MRILIFILLKIVELSIITLIPYGTGFLVDKYILKQLGKNWLAKWFFGVCIIACIFLGMVLLSIIYRIILSNWDFAGRLME